MTSPKITPMMAQWARCKEQVGEALLLFRLGDFYEAFGEDALTVSKALDLTLTKRQDTPMCGIPWHSSEGYLDRLLVRGFSVAIAEQINTSNETTSSAKPLMDRQIVRILTPGTAMKGTLVQDSSNTLICSISKQGSAWGVALVDVTTALFQVLEVSSPEELIRELLRLRPKEIICCQALVKLNPELIAQIEQGTGTKKAIPPSWTYELTSARTVLQNHFKTVTLDGFGLRDSPAAICAAGSLICHLKDTLLVPVSHLKSIELVTTEHRMVLDRATLTNLDIFESGSKAEGGQSLFDVINDTKTPMGARLLRNWLLNPLTDIHTIQQRHDIVEACLCFITSEKTASAQAIHSLSSIRDIERLVLRIQTGGAGPRDVLFLAQCSSHIKALQQSLLTLSHSAMSSKIQSLPSLEPLVTRIVQTITEEPPVRISDGGAIREGVHAELDNLREIHHNSHKWLVEYQTKLREELGIKTLKVGYTRAFGYYIEVSRGQSDRVPSSFCRRQTLTGAERFISEELKQFEDKVLTAEKKIEGLENALFEELKAFVSTYADAVLSASKVIAEIDLFFGLANIAHKRRYTRPEMVGEPVLSITGGRHPIAETQVTTAFVQNDLHISAEGPSLLLITGPNMAGKSTYVRQTALLVILAQIGSFIPANGAKIGVVDRVFSRVGASDDLFRGQSTFMVEMAETASILNQATARSLILLDEIGRGTSTYDGISIAWAVAEYLLRNPKANPRTLFATHYYELTELEQKFSSARNMTVAVSEQSTSIRFLYKVVPGKTDRSYGIHVARLAGLPEQVLARAEAILHQLEEQRPRSTTTCIQQELFAIAPSSKKENPEALACYEFLRNLDLAKLAPIECFMKLAKFKNSLQTKF
jgi:DNA mismatch repair protein MutS